jgi:hypothetical protein
MISDGGRTGGSSVNNEKLGCSAPPENVSRNHSDASFMAGDSGHDVSQAALSICGSKSHDEEGISLKLNHASVLPSDCQQSSFSSGKSETDAELTSHSGSNARM